MSGICGIVSFDGGPPDPALLTRMSGCVRHAGARNPARRALFGSMRVIPGGAPAAEPVAQDGLLLIADIRLDNRAELEAQLPCPGSASGSSTEGLLLAAYRRWGTGCFGRLRGAYGLALWDEQRSTLILARDPMGERAVYWTWAAGRLLFASEPSCLARSGCVSCEPDAQRLLAHLIGSDPAAERSFFREVRRLPEGCHLLADGGTPSLDRHWTWEALLPERRSVAEASDELARRLTRAVRCRLQDTGECGVVLSGGLDSASVAAVAAAALGSGGRVLRAFTWSSAVGDPIDERERSGRLLARLPAAVEHAVEADNLWPLSRYPEAYGDPSAPEGSAYPDLQWTTIETARHNGVRTLLNGVGGDPVIGWTAPEMALLCRGRWAALARRWTRGAVPGSSLLRQLRQTGRRALPVWLTAGAARAARSADLDRPPVPMRALMSPAAFRRFTVTRYTNAENLERYDRLSRRTGVRIAAPWHDQELASLVLSLPDGGVDLGGPGKSLLRRAMAGRLPDCILGASAGKHGPSPLRARGLTRFGKDRVERFLERSVLVELGLIDGDSVRARYRDAAARSTLMPRLWEIVTAECWLRARAARPGAAAQNSFEGVLGDGGR